MFTNFYLLDTGASSQIERLSSAESFAADGTATLVALPLDEVDILFLAFLFSSSL